MGYIRPTQQNPFGLTLKQLLFIENIVRDIVNGKPINPIDAVKKVYDVKSYNTAKSMASENLTKPNIHKALASMLEKRGIAGPNGKIEKKLIEGLDAIIPLEGVNRGSPAQPDFKMRLEYIKEINKVVGLY